MRVKVCGITNEKDAQRAVECGADALGFIFHDKSPRAIQPEKAQLIIGTLPPFLETVGVFVDASETQIRKIRALTGVHLVQLHGQETPRFCERFFPYAIKALRMHGGMWADSLEAYRVVAFLLDGFVQFRGADETGSMNWLPVRQAAKKWRVILAGGLNPENVRQAIDLVQPYAVDVASGIEIKPGMKDWAKMKDFIQRAKSGGDHDGPLEAA